MQILQRIPVAVAAAIMGTGLTYVQNGLKAGTLPFGTATAKDPGRKGARHTFHISPAKFKAYTGVNDDIIREVAANIGAPLKFMEVNV